MTDFPLINIALIKNNKKNINALAGRLELSFNSALCSKVQRLDKAINAAHETLLTHTVKIAVRLTDKNYIRLRPMILEIENSPSLGDEQKKQSIAALEYDYLTSQKESHRVIAQLLLAMENTQNDLEDIKLSELDLRVPHSMTEDINTELENSKIRQQQLTVDLQTLSTAIHLIDDKNIADYLMDWIPSEETINAVSFSASKVEILKQALLLLKKYVSYISEHLNYLKMIEARNVLRLEIQKCRDRESVLVGLQNNHTAVTQALNEAESLNVLKNDYHTQATNVTRRIEHYMGKVNFDGPLSSDNVDAIKDEMQQLEAFLKPLTSIRLPK
ncbi:MULTISPECIES: alpha-xenorhabdolysin family binary toxin subunit B [unclassified Pseudomonas]|uniref:alpha-xenorhabdolysin family binary toxin subunit B n=1 Tax=unclassified Pseudomonas TaxID=196821 RepID=UPI0015B39630|nr:alpha-xenorhabdolysin family binary toxin subunit B [Pseudomonas sp.]